MVTLVTCYPYGVNTHRLLVKAERCEYIEYEEDSILDTLQTATKSNNLWLYILGILMIIAIIIIIIILIIDNKKEKKKGN